MSANGKLISRCWCGDVPLGTYGRMEDNAEIEFRKCQPERGENFFIIVYKPGANTTLPNQHIEGATLL